MEGVEACFRKGNATQKKGRNSPPKRGKNLSTSEFTEYLSNQRHIGRFGYCNRARVDQVIQPNRHTSLTRKNQESIFACNVAFSCHRRSSLSDAVILSVLKIWVLFVSLCRNYPRHWYFGFQCSHSIDSHHMYDSVLTTA